MTYSIISFYHFAPIENPHEEVKKQHLFFEGHEMRSRIYISHKGINGIVSALVEEGQKYRDWLREDPRFSDMEFKIESYHEHVLPRVTIKFRQQLVALDVQPDLKKGGEYVSPEKWKEMLENRDENTLLIDVRNDYEWKIGHFEGAILPQLEAFRDFPKYAKKLSSKKDPKNTKIMMYCTGGIRCELYSALLKEKGFRNVFQLHGGVIRYGQKVGNKYWKGKLFVFDDRLSTHIGENTEPELISSCQFCQTSIDVYYNCANMDCNELFLSCPKCAEKNLGCCSESCQKAKRKRPFIQTEQPKPFRKWYHYIKDKKEWK